MQLVRQNIGLCTVFGQYFIRYLLQDIGKLVPKWGLHRYIKGTPGGSMLRSQNSSTDFHKFSAKKLAVFSKTNVIMQFLENCILNQLQELFLRNYFESHKMH
jgi:hypothetical protein